MRGWAPEGVTGAASLSRSPSVSAAASCLPAARKAAPGGQLNGLLRRLVPAVEALLQLGCGILGRVGAVDDVGRFHPGLVLEVRACRATAFGRSTASSTCSPCGSRRTLAPACRSTAIGLRLQAEEAGQRVRVQRGEFRRSDPGQEGLGGLRRSCSWRSCQKRCPDDRRCSRGRPPWAPAARRHPS